MSDPKRSIDFLLRWTTPEVETSPLDASRDSLKMAPVDHAAGAWEASEGESEEAAEEWAEPSEASPEEADGHESFEWSCDREQAIIDALESAPAGAVPRVHQQLDAITVALKGGVLSPERAGQLLDEVDAYLARRVAAEQRKAPVGDPAFVSSRVNKGNALAAYQESAAALREYSANGESVQLKVAHYAAEQGRAFLLTARDTLLAGEPDFDVDDDDDETDEGDQETER